MEKVEFEVPRPKPLSEDSLALQDAEGQPGAFVYFRRFFRDGVELRRDEKGELESDFIVLILSSEHQAIGRHPRCDIILAWDPSVSRSHAELSNVGGDWYVEDLGSENGTSVNGARVARRRLGDGDQIRLGDTALVFRHISSTELGDTVKSATILPVLSDPQKKVLLALAEPLFSSGNLPDPATNAEIAGRLHLSVDSVKGHLRHLYKAFGIGSDIPQNRKRRMLADEAISRGAVTHRDYS